MKGYFQLKMKRKDFEDVTNDFSEFSLSSPARKIRRLDVGLPPIIEEEEPEVPLTIEQQSELQEQSFGSNESEGLKIEELPSVPDNEQRAIVLFNPMADTPLLHSPSDFSVDPHLISGLKNQVLWPSQSNSWRLANDEVVANEPSSSSGNGCLAVVPWVAPQLPSVPLAEFPCQIDSCEMMMDAEEASMEVEDSMGINGNEAGEVTLSEGIIHQWQQQHCMIPHPPHNTTTPVLWYR